MVIGKVKPVTAALIGGNQASRELRAGHAHDPWGQQAELELGGRRRLSGPPAALKDVGVGAGQLDRRSALTGELSQ